MGIMSINKPELLKTVEKDIQFSGLFPLANRTKEDYYRASDAVMRYYKKSGFSIKWIECDGNLKSIMYEVRNDMGI